MNKEEKIKQILKDEIEYLEIRLEDEIKKKIDGKEPKIEFSWIDVLSFRKCELDRILSRIEEEV